MEYKVGLRYKEMKVRVAKVPPNEPDYAELLGKNGVIDGEPDCFDGVWWVFVTLEGENIPTEFNLDELAPVDIHIIEGVLRPRPDMYWPAPWLIGDAYLDETLAELDGKRIRVTIEVLDEGEATKNG